MRLGSVFILTPLTYIQRYKECIEINVEKEVVRKNGGGILDIYRVKTRLTIK